LRNKEGEREMRRRRRNTEDKTCASLLGTEKRNHNDDVLKETLSNKKKS
jgi:hypothetical protein